MAKRNRTVRKAAPLDKSKLTMRARNIVAKRGANLHFLGGTALNNTVTEGMPALVQAESSPIAKAALADAIQEQIRSYKYTWTITCAFFHEKDGEYLVRCERFYLENMTASVMDEESTKHMSTLWKDEDKATRIGQLWIATPAKLGGNYIEMIEGIDEFLEKNNFFDEKFMRGRLTYNALLALEYAEVMNQLEEAM